MREAILPDWAEDRGNGKIRIEATKFYPEWLERLGLEGKDAYELELAKQCAKKEIKLAVAGTSANCKPGGSLEIKITDASKEQGTYKQTGENLDEQLERAGKDARKAFEKIIGVSI